MACRLSKLALPIFLQNIIASSSQLIDTSFVGHLPDPVLLSAMVLATSLSMVSGYSIVLGMASALETLSGHAFGAAHFTALQDTLQRAFLITSLTCVPITVVWCNAKSILLALGQSVAISEGAAKYLRLTLPALYLYTIYECVDKYLLSQRVVKPSLLITTVGTALSPVFAWLFVVRFNWGLEGAALAYVVVQATSTTLLLLYLAYREIWYLPRRHYKGWKPLRPSKGALQNWGPYLTLAFPAVMSHCMEGWATEVLIFLAGLLDNADVAVGVTGLALQFSTLVWLAASAISSATGIRVANKLGRGDAIGARRTTRVAVGSVLISQSCIGVMAFIFREPLLKVMTGSREVIELAMQVMPVLACCFITDGLNVVQSAVLTGAGRQWWTAGLSLAGWWCVGIPLAAYFALVRHWNAPGLWGGFAIASVLQSILLAIAISVFIDWSEEVRRAKVMLHGGPPPPDIDDDDALEQDIDEDEHLLSVLEEMEGEEEDDSNMRRPHRGLMFSKSVPTSPNARYALFGSVHSILESGFAGIYRPPSTTAATAVATPTATATRAGDRYGMLASSVDTLPGRPPVLTPGDTLFAPAGQDVQHTTYTVLGTSCDAMIGGAAIHNLMSQQQGATDAAGDQANTSILAPRMSALHSTGSTAFAQPFVLEGLSNAVFSGAASSRDGAVESAQGTSAQTEAGADAVPFKRYDGFHPT